MFYHSNIADGVHELHVWICHLNMNSCNILFVAEPIHSRCDVVGSLPFPTRYALIYMKKETNTNVCTFVGSFTTQNQEKFPSNIF